MENRYTPPQKKKVTSIALETDVRAWVDANIPNRSHFFNQLAKQYIASQQPGKAKKGKNHG